MHKETQAFLQTLFAPCHDGYVTLTAIHPDRQHPTPSRHIPLHDEAALSNSLIDLQRANQQGWGAFFGVATRQADLGRWRRGGQADVLALPAVFVDLDMPLNESLPRLRAHDPPPSCIIGSGGGAHAYWFLDRATSDWALAAQVLHQLRHRLGSDRSSDSQLLRLPGSMNTKPSRHNAPCQLLDLQSTRYPLSIFLDQTSDVFDATANTKPLAVGRLQPSSQSRHDHGPLNPHLVTAVEDALVHQYGGFRQRNGWLAAYCPCGHHRDAPGMHFGFNSWNGVGVCLGRHGRLLLKDLCLLLHLRPSDYGGFYSAFDVTQNH